MTPRFRVLAAVALGVAALRLLPHPPGFTPVGALALFGGAHFASRRAALAVPMLAMAASDLVLGVTVYGVQVLALMPWVYASFALTVVLGRALRHHRGAASVAATSLAAALVFFAVTNFGEWARGTLYPPTPAGLATCYLAALPYLRNMLLGNLVYALALFGSFELARRRFPRLGEPLAAAGRA